MLRLVRTELGTRRGIGVWAFLLALGTAGALAHVAVRMKGIEVAYDLGRERRAAKELEEQRRRLNIEIGMLKDPVRVVSLARDKLGMGPPAPSAMVDLRGLPGAAAAPEEPRR
jgi:cell division protein FtsL